MESSTLSGRSILIAEDEPLIALDIAEAFKDAGATTIVTSTLHHALVLVEHDGLSAAVLDHALPDGDSSPLCQRLDDRKLPFVIYSGLGELHGACAKGVQVAKPENPKALVVMVANLISGATPDNGPTTGRC
jgi:DNA-binding response OmpR family regulator